MKRSLRKNPSSLLSLVAIAVIIGALAVWNQSLTEPEATQEQQPLAYSVSEAPQTETVETETTELPQETVTVTEDLPPEEESISVAVTVENWVMPGSSQWNSGFGYRLDPTMGDYRFHNGADMEMAEGALVFAAAEGIISKIYTDEQWGNCIEISHPGQMTSIYRGVRASQIAEGDQVAAGDTIGVLTASPPAESLQPPHLHLEISDSKGLCDPQEFIK